MDVTLSTGAGRRAPAFLLAVVLCCAGGGPGPAWAQARPLSVAEVAGTWDLSWEKGNRRCRLVLRGESGADHQGVAMPAGCRHAFPTLAGVVAWTADDKEHVVLRSATGQPVVDFGPSGSANLTAVVGEEGDIYALTPVDPAVQEALATIGRAPEPALPAEDLAPAVPGGVLVGAAGASALAAGAAAPAPNLPPATAAEVAGNYAVLRQTRDTGCMVTLDPGGASRAEPRAKLAPACRDQGIVIFDPVGWQISKGQLVLTAKRGHKTILTRQVDRTWATAPVKGAALVLKRL